MFSAARGTASSVGWRAATRRWECVRCFTRNPTTPVVPIVDLSNSKQASVDLHHAFSTYGCCYLKGHGIDTPQEARVMDAAHAYFDMAQEVKDKYHRPSSSTGFVRGYIGLGAESGSADFVEVKEGFSYGYEWDATIAPSNPLQGPNVWPSELATSHQRALQSLFTTLVGVSNRLCDALSVALNKPPSYFSSFCTHGDTISILRAFHYFPYSVLPRGGRNVIGSSPHTDWGFLTLILQDKVGGLQLFHDGKWTDVPYIPGTLFVNGGDYLSLLTDGTWRSPVHRVVNDVEHDRTSLVFFYYPDYDARIPPIAKATTATRPGLLANVNTLLDHTVASNHEPFGQYIQSKWAAVQRDG
ncbi:hypothetical protein H310_12856 [Aphanomyces invadans]|uniref:Fe2OG dioxygenase domain-containing protein n=1 Tax=Aphanomyces invadans TaxID=157072 RepID=A0A024TFT9_9STRA|nr:hypothetical protein H310_12856 [Aphanomyces invadans]ETV93025.1 hypothetical protein H310_12856 [Aphanomyces invadans]|eukprot:XP_008878290.1 hypothetical protein H310_12856 [Aphanomyces invadans]